MNTWILVELHPNDVMSIVTHWHHEPNNQEVADMVNELPPQPYHQTFVVVPANLPWIVEKG